MEYDYWNDYEDETETDLEEWWKAPHITETLSKLPKTSPSSDYDIPAYKETPSVSSGSFDLPGYDVASASPGAVSTRSEPRSELGVETGTSSQDPVLSRIQYATTITEARNALRAAQAAGRTGTTTGSASSVSPSSVTGFQTEQMPELREIGTTTTTTGTTTPITPTIPMPTFELPERDEERVKELRAQSMGAPLRKTSQEARRALSAINAMEGPLAKEAYRGWTEGLGTGISNIAAQATTQAEQLYGAERAEEINAMLTNFDAEVNDYFRQYGQETTTTTERETEFAQIEYPEDINDEYEIIPLEVE
jgi:hypothetical protein